MVRVEKASSIFPTADILSYYETTASFDSNARGFIIEKGFQEWLLAVNIEHEAKKPDMEFPNIRALRSMSPVTDLITLIPNLIGGATNEQPV